MEFTSVLQMIYQESCRELRKNPSKNPLQKHLSDNCKKCLKGCHVNLLRESSRIYPVIQRELPKFPREFFSEILEELFILENPSFWDLVLRVFFY